MIIWKHKWLLLAASVVVLLAGTLAIVQASRHRQGAEAPAMATPTPAVTESTPDTTGQTPAAGGTNSPSPSPTPDKPEIAPLLSKLEITQEDAFGSEGLAVWDDEHRFDESKTYHLTKQNVLIRMTVKADQAADFAQAMPQISVTGGASGDWSQERLPDGETGYSLRIADIADSATVQFDNGHALTFIQDHPLVNITVADDEGFHVMPYGRTVIVQSAQPVRSFTLSFSEEMSPDSSFQFYPDNVKASGQWTDDRHYRIAVDRAPDEYQVVPGNLYDKSGNARFALDDYWMQRVKPAQWLDLATGDQVGFSARDRYYDFLKPSADPDKYLGFSDVLLAIHDGSNAFQITLERRGRPPVVVKQADNVGGYAAEWVDRDRFVYWGADGIFLFNTEDDSRKPLLQIGDNQNLYDVVYDASQQRLTARLAVHDEWSGRYGPDTGYEIWESDNLQPAVKQAFQQTDQVADYPGLKPYIQGAGGTFHTQGLGIGEETWYEKNDGTTEKTAGSLIAVHDDYAIVMTKTDGMPAHFYKWMPGSEPELLPQPPGNVRPFGSMLIAAAWKNRSEKNYWRFSFSANRWESLNFQGDIPFVPYQPDYSFYRASFGS